MSGATGPTVAALSPLEKAALLSGADSWRSRAVPRIGLRSLFMADGPHGLRKQAGTADHLGLNQSLPATCFPTAAAIANSWDPDLAERVGRALGREAALIGVDVILGPGLNIKRSPLGGRNFEYFSEDPYLSGKLAAGYVRGIQSAGVAACPKHFAVNSQETRRMASDSTVDAKTLREIYLTAFEIMVRESHPWAIMSSYNLLNGAYTHEHRELLQGILREEWGFDGAVVTDWGGCNDPVAAITAGGTLQMPSPGFDSARQILEHGGLDQAAWDARVAEVVSLAGRIKPVSVTEAVYAEHQELAREAAAASLVLLRNRGSLLPLAAGTRVAVVGEFAFEQRYQGAGSSLVNPTALEHPIDSLRDSSLDVVAAVRGFERGRPADPVLIAEAVDAAGQAPVVLAYLGLEESDEVEGKDREHLRLPPAQLRLLAAVAQANPNVVVVLAAGSVVEFPWLGQARAVLHTSLGGQAGASAAVAALLGEVNPAGRLAETYPLALADTPTAGRFPARGQHALYKEGPFVGYRYYQTAKVPVRFPFGFGLSYTRFEYEDLAATPDQLLVTVRNTGTRAGADVPQVYVAAPREADALDPRPAFQLKGFQKVCLEPGESRRVAVPLDRYAFRAFDAVRERWVVVGGDYEISVGSSAATRPLRAAVPVPGETAPRPLPGSGGMHRSTRSGSPNGGPPRPEATGAGPASPPPEASHLAKVVSGNSPMGPARGAAKRSPAETPEASAAGRPLDATAGPESAPLPHYAAADPRGVTDAEFAALLGRPLPPEPTPGAPLERTSPLSDLEHAPGWIGRAIHRHYFRRRLDRAARDGQPDLNLLFQHGMLFRTIANMSGGLADMRLVDGVLALVNGHPWIGAGRVMAAFATGRARERALKKRFERAAEAAPARPSAAAHPATGGPAPQDGRARSAVGAGLPRAARPAVDPATARTPSRTAQPERE